MGIFVAYKAGLFVLSPKPNRHIAFFYQILCQLSPAALQFIVIYHTPLLMWKFEMIEEEIGNMTLPLALTLPLVIFEECTQKGTESLQRCFDVVEQGS